MKIESDPRRFRTRLSTLGVALALLATGCGPGNSDGGSETASRATIQNKGSDTMVNIAQAWAEEYKQVSPAVDVEVSGGGSGQGIAALIKGTIDIANCSRNMKAEEIAQAKKNTGKEPKEFVVGYDALAIYVHKDNPLNEITFEQLREIYAEGGKLTRWSQLGIQMNSSGADEIIRVSRQSSSGTYEFFREHVLDKRDFKLNSRDMNGSKEVVELVSSTPGAIGYSGMGYATTAVKMLQVRAQAADPAYAPSLENTRSHKYPISRSLLMYTLGEPSGEPAEYLRWILSPAGQHVVAASGYVPLPTEPRHP